jgi:hypothetical protein
MSDLTILTIKNENLDTTHILDMLNWKNVYDDSILVALIMKNSYPLQQPN